MAGKGIIREVENGFKFYDQSIAIHYLANRCNEINYGKLFFNSGLMWHYINEKYGKEKGSFWFPTPQICYLYIQTIWISII